MVNRNTYLSLSYILPISLFLTQNIFFAKKISRSTCWIFTSKFWRLPIFLLPLFLPNVLPMQKGIFERTAISCYNHSGRTSTFYSYALIKRRYALYICDTVDARLHRLRFQRTLASPIEADIWNLKYRGVRDALWFNQFYALRECIRALQQSCEFQQKSDCKLPWYSQGSLSTSAISAVALSRDENFMCIFTKVHFLRFYSALRRSVKREDNAFERCVHRAKGAHVNVQVCAVFIKHHKFVAFLPLQSRIRFPCLFIVNSATRPSLARIFAQHSCLTLPLELVDKPVDGMPHALRLCIARADQTHETSARIDCLLLLVGFKQRLCAFGVNHAEKEWVAISKRTNLRKQNAFVSLITCCNFIIIRRESNFLFTEYADGICRYCI